MKTKSFILITILLIAYSCKKQPEVTLPPLLDIKFENVPSGTLESSAQDTVFAEYFVSPLLVHIIEYHLEQFKLKNPDIDQSVFAFQVTSSEDSEVFIKGRNILATSGGMAFNKNYYVTQVYNNFAVPVKLSDRVIKNNDTIEHRQDTGYLKVQYRSGYSGRIIRKTLIIN
jgi:hypothetical protein